MQTSCLVEFTIEKFKYLMSFGKFIKEYCIQSYKLIYL